MLFTDGQFERWTGTTLVGASGPPVICVGSSSFPTASIATGSSTVFFGLGVRHLVGTTLSQTPVEAAITEHATRVVVTGCTGHRFKVIVNGIPVQDGLHV